jgi:hypothetical protein
VRPLRRKMKTLAVAALALAVGAATAQTPTSAPNTFTQVSPGLPTPQPTTLQPTGWTPTVPAGTFPGLSLCTKNMEYDYDRPAHLGPRTFVCREDGTEVFTRSDDKCGDDRNQGWYPCKGCSGWGWFSTGCCCTCGTKWSGVCPPLPDGCYQCIRTTEWFFRTVYKLGACNAADANCVTCDSNGVFLAKSCP